MHRFTHVLALLLVQGTYARVNEDYEPIADAIEVILQGYPDEQKADLYALLAEAIDPGMTFEALRRTVNEALVTNELGFIRG